MHVKSLEGFLEIMQVIANLGQVVRSTPHSPIDTLRTAWRTNLRHTTASELPKPFDREFSEVKSAIHGGTEDDGEVVRRFLAFADRIQRVP